MCISVRVRTCVCERGKWGEKAIERERSGGIKREKGKGGEQRKCKIIEGDERESVNIQLDIREKFRRKENGES